MENDGEMFGAHGTITNRSSQAVDVPTLLVVLRDKNDRIVFMKDIMAQKQRLEPGEALSVDEILAPIPKQVRFADIGWKLEGR